MLHVIQITGKQKEISGALRDFISMLEYDRVWRVEVSMITRKGKKKILYKLEDKN